MEGRSRFIFRRLAVQQFNTIIKIIDVIYFVKNRKTAKQEEDQL